MKTLFVLSKYEQLKQKLIYANLKQTPEHYVLMKILSCLLLFWAGVLLFSLFWALIAALIFYIIYDYLVLEYLIKKRINQLDEQAQYFLEVLILALETGSSIEKAISLAISEDDSDLAQQFEQVLLEIKLGHSLPEALTNMQKRIPSESIDNILLSISDTSSLGVSLIASLQEQLSFLQRKNFLQKKEAINKIPVKVSIVSVLLILPIIFLLILSPLILNFLG